MLWQGFALVLCGAFLQAIYYVTNKKLLIKAAPADCISTANFLVSGAILLILSLTLNPPKVESWFDFPHGLLWPLLATSLLNIIIGFGNIRALKYGDVSLIMPMSAAQPMIVIIPSMLILGEYPGFTGWLGLWMIAFGTYVFSFGENVEGWQCPKSLKWMGSKARYFAPWQMLFKNRGVRIALMVACCGAVAINFDKQSALRSSTTFAPAVIYLFIGTVGLIKVFRTGEWRKLEKAHLTNLATNPLTWAVILICQWTAFSYGFAAYVGAIKRFNIVFILIFSLFLLKEQAVKKRWPGAIIMAIGAVLLSL